MDIPTAVIVNSETPKGTARLQEKQSQMRDRQATAKILARELAKLKPKTAVPQYAQLDKRMRQRLKLVLLDLAEDKRTPLAERMKLAEQLIEVEQYERQHDDIKDRQKLEAMKLAHQEAMKARLEHRKRKADAPPKDAPRPQVAGPNALGL